MGDKRERERERERDSQTDIQTGREHVYITDDFYVIATLKRFKLLYDNLPASDHRN